MVEKEIPRDQTRQDLIPVLLEIQTELEDLFTILQINYREKVLSIKESNEINIKNNQNEIIGKLQLLLQKTEEISSIKTLINYREFGNIINSILSSIKKMQSHLSSNLTEFHQESYRLLKYYWAIRYVIARFELELTPEFMTEQIMFFNLPDELFEFLESLKDGPKPIEILRDVDLEVRIHKGLPLLISRGTDEITLSDLGVKFFTVHSVSDLYFYYLYDFEEEVLNSNP